MLTDRSRIARPFARKALCSSLAIATALLSAPNESRAQVVPGSFQGTGTFVVGSGSISPVGSTTTIDLTSADAVINWTTFDAAIGGGPIDFQPTGTTATFQRVGQDFSVLNRIFPNDPSRAVQFNGTVISQIQSTVTAPGGSVYFYSPGGVIIGSTAVFNVGNLGLTSIAPEVVGGVFEQTGTGGDFVRFNGAVTPGSAVQIQAGAQIMSSSSNGIGSYVALVAPVIEHRGTINVDGVAALVSADAATITFNPTGLFDIQVTSGTSATGFAINNATGVITGPAFQGTGANHRIYAVAVPKNTAITMAIGRGSRLGFNIAGAANVVGNAVVLSAGHNITAGQIEEAPAGGTGQTFLSINDSNTLQPGTGIDFTSAVTARSSNQLDVQVFRQTNFASDALLQATNLSQVLVTGFTGASPTPGSLTVGGNLTVTTDRSSARATGNDAGNAIVDVFNGSSVMVGGSLTVSAGAFTDSTGDGAATGGTSQFRASQAANVDITGNLVVRGFGVGGLNQSGVGSGNIQLSLNSAATVDVGAVTRIVANGIGAGGRSGSGGFAGLSISGGAVLTTSELNVAADGVGGNDVGTGAGNGIGGNANIAVNGAGSRLTVANGNTLGVVANGERDFLSAEGFGGQNNGGGSGFGGTATGGSASISVTNGATLAGPANGGTQSFVRIIARAAGGNANTGATAGGVATGGNINITVDNATLASFDLLPSSFAQGGSALVTATGTINGGNATGGTRNITVRNGATATTSFSGGGPGAQGGNGTLSGRGGDATGGSASLLVNNATLDLNGRGLVFSQNMAGAGGTTGNVTAGSASVTVSNGGTISVPDIAGFDDLFVGSNAFGAASSSAPGTAQGNVTAGTATLLLQNGTITGAGSILVQAGAFASSDRYAQGGSYRGGQANVFLQGGSISNPLLTVEANATAANIGAGVAGTAGSATGGFAQVQSTSGTTGLTNVTVGASGIGGNVTGTGTGTGGSGTGGRANIGTNTGATLNVSGNISLTANGTGGSDTGTGGSGVGGVGTGGLAELGTFMGGTFNLTGTLDAFARGLGGSATRSGFAAATGTGGTAQVYHDTAGAIALASSVNLNATGSGGTALVSGVAGGQGRGGNARTILYNAGTATLTIGGTVFADASGVGSAGNNANGGDGFGGNARIGADAAGKMITVTGAATLIGSGFGGDGGGVGAGGKATAGFATAGANGGSITFNGNLTATATTVGGNGTIGGNASGAVPGGTPNAFIFANNGNLTVTGVTTLGVDLRGGAGAFGGKGGDATGGRVLVEAQSNPAGASSISLRDLIGSANAYGGVGGVGLSTSVGGAGGTAYAGSVQIFGHAGNGQLTVAAPAFLNALAFGGAGGQGGGGTSPGTGGIGGTGVGGEARFGTRTGIETGAINTGSASFAAVQASAHGTGGSGGAGGAGTVQGTGGAGGAAFNGAAAIAVRGSQVTLNQPVTLGADSTGGAGGAGSTAGTGGNATAGTDWMLANGGGVFVSVINRTLHPEQPGRLSAGNITGSATAIGGAGSMPGASLLGELPLRLEITNSLATIGTLDLRNVASDATGSITPSALVLVGSTASINNLSLITPGPLSVSLDSSTLNTASLTFSAGNFVLPTVAPTLRGTINVSSGLNISSAADFLAYANFNVGFNGAFSVGGSVLIGDLTLAGAVDIVAGGSITTGTISASDVALDAGQSILTAEITTGGDIDLDAGGAITTGALVAGDTIGVDAVGALNVASASAGIVNPSTATGAEYNIGLRSRTSIIAGDLSARAGAGVSSPGAIAVGNVNAGQAFLALPGTSLTTGTITTSLNGGRVYIANNSMEALGGQIAGVFNPAPILAATPVATSGPITINGAVTTSVLQANTTQSLAITGATVARGTAVLVAGTTLNAANITVGDRAVIAAGGNIVLGDVNAGASPALPPSGLRKIAIGSSTGNVTTGNLTAGSDLGIQAGGGIATGTLLGRQILLLAGTSVSTGSISALVGTQPIGQVYIGNFSMANQTTNVFQPLQNLALFNTNPVRTGGPITIGGSVQAGSLFAATAQGISLQAATANLDANGNLGFIDIDSGGLATINGAIRAGDRIDIASRDIDITTTGSLDGLSSLGEIQLASNNPNGAFIGDGLTTTAGYMLSQAEYARLKAGEIAIVGDDIAGLATDLTIGTLTINAGQLYGANGVALFASGNRSTETPSGILRIAGAVTANGFAPTNEIELLSGTVELEAERGSLKVNAGQSDSGTTSSSSLGGLIFIEADRIHVASDAILTKLRADPLYTGHIDELNAPASVQRPDGVLNALGFEINVGETFYIQNTGSRIVPAGFLTTFDNTEVFASGDRTGGAEIVINGQFRTSTGTITGKAAFDQVAADPTADSEQFFGFSETSQLNGCVFLGGVCAFGQSDPVAAISSEIKLVTNATLDESPVAPAADDSDEGDDGSSDKDDDDSAADEGSSPISPPTPLISTRALDGAVNVVEPVSGAGNPALFGSAVNETTVQGEKP